MFGSRTVANMEFSTKGFRNWKKIFGSRGVGSKYTKSKLELHSNCQYHLTCMTKWHAHIQSKTSGSVHTLVTNAHRDKILENRDYMLTLIDIILFLAHQGVAFRGHIENETSLNQGELGNLKEACKLMAKYNPTFALNYAKPTNHTSWLIQNQIIEICAKHLRNTIVEDIISAGMYSVSCDEARCHKEEQLAVCVRYPKNLKVEERFVGFLDVSQSQNADSQSYDGASVMSGHTGGVQAKLKEIHPKAIYVHCMAHKLNLVVIDMCKHLKDARNLFNGLEALYVHFSQPTKNKKMTDIQEKLGVKKTKIPQNRITKIKDVAQAIGLLSTIKNGKFVVHLFVLNDVLKIINILSTQLQSKSTTLGKSSSLVCGVIDTLKNNRSDVYFDNLWNDITIFCEEHDVSLDIPSQGGSKRRRREPTYLQQYAVLSTTSAEEYRVNDVLMGTSINKNYWKMHCFYPILDIIIVNMEKRFSPESMEIAQSVDNFLKLNFNESLQFINHYKDLFGVSKDSLRSEMMVIKNTLKVNVDLEVLQNHLNSLNSKQIFPNYYKLFNVAITLPINSATCERSFSAMRRLKTWMRTTMLQERFSNLGIINIEKDINIDRVSVLNDFAKSNRRINLIL
ncbi:zinc finger MYM-type protein 1-like [Aphis gossypii]|uniref:zinc finger MYM-type protein 1-like n=1 Tax=Aphis gossypii TaxID=80765 RepID=UPI0021596D8E|nr:zinc finger MYM-type protein 1-like [Aphis gossypii]